jgi:hypothetical protein
MKSGKFRPKHFFLLLLIFVLATSIIDLVRISGYRVIPMRPSEPIDSRQNELYFDLANGKKDIRWEDLDGTLKYIAAEYDCADFRLVNLVRILYDYGDLIPAAHRSNIDTVLLNFRYWWDEPGENSMCYWSENHQILFASAEYLIGQLYPGTVFPNSGLTGIQHMDKARTRILDWLEMRWNYGFIEYYSGTYYKEDVGALLNLIDYAGEEELVIKSQIIMDLLFYDVAAQNIKNMFVSVSGRAYERNRKGGPGSTLGGLTDYLWGDGTPVSDGMLYGMMQTRNYTLPPVLAAIAGDSSDVIIKQNNGLDISELKTEGYFGTDNRSMMMQWGMECFTNREIIRHSLSHIRRCNMFSNEFVADFRMLDFKLIHWLHLEPFLNRILKPQTDGVAIQKGNTYTFKTRDFSMYTVQSHHPGSYGDQQHVFGLNMGNHFSIFHTHPALEKGVKHQSPNYWVGYGHFPHSVQDENVNLSIYNIPSRKAPMEMALLDYTRAYFPLDLFDTAFIADNYLFGKKNDAYCALIGTTNFSFRDEARDDIIQEGKQVFWITEAGSRERDGNFLDFVQRIRNNRVEFDREMLELTYGSNGQVFQLTFGGDFRINNKIIATEYSRYESPYIRAEKKDQTLTFSFEGESLFLDFEKLQRVY